jgi:GH15 family glucan-1,4-alpha-glucosidase
VLTSLIVLRAMTFETSGAVIAAPTTSLSEDLGAQRNWDYRFCWLRDSVHTYSKVMAGVLFDRAVQLAETFALDGPVKRWKQIRDQIH